MKSAKENEMDNKTYKELTAVLARLKPAELATIGLAVKQDKNAFLVAVDEGIRVNTQVKDWIDESLKKFFAVR